MNQNQNTTSNLVLMLGLVGSIAVCFLAGSIGAYATSGSVDSNWFVELKKPAWNPPNWLFGPVWSVLYLMMGIAAWLVWKQSGFSNARLALGWFGFHLLLNVFWSVLFFGMQQVGWAAIEIIVLWISIAITMILFKRHSKTATMLLVPYLLWVTFAAALNIAIFSLN